jgi:hypothetical protein
MGYSKSVENEIEERKKRSREKICPSLKESLSELHKKKREHSRGRNDKKGSGNSEQRVLS